MDFNSHCNARSSERLSEPCSMLVRRVSDGMEGLVKSGDIGFGGVAFKSSHPIGVGTELELLMVVERGVIRAAGRVAHILQNVVGGYTVGVEFTMVDARGERMLRSLLELEGIFQINPERGCRAAA